MQSSDTSRELRLTTYSAPLETSWVRCKALAYLYSKFNDQITCQKDTYSEDDGYLEAIELVMLNNQEEVVGILDIGIFNEERNRYDSYVKELDRGSYMDIIAVHPNYQKQGIAQKLLNEGFRLLRKKGIEYVSIFTRDDTPANNLYIKNGAILRAKNYRIKGTLKDQMTDISLFQVHTDTNTIEVRDSKNKEVPYMIDTSYFWVYKKEYLELFYIEGCIAEHSYFIKL